MQRDLHVTGMLDYLYLMDIENLRKRFWSKIYPAFGCWIWIGNTDGRYGTLSTFHGASGIKAHIVSWIIHYGPIPEGKKLLHQCDHTLCVRPEHLRLGTQKENIQDMVRKNRINPKVFLNLRPGARGYHGAGPKSNEEIKHEQGISVGSSR